MARFYTEERSIDRLTGDCILESRMNIKGHPEMAYGQILIKYNGRNHINGYLNFEKFRKRS